MTSLQVSRLVTVKTMCLGERQFDFISGESLACRDVIQIHSMIA